MYVIQHKYSLENKNVCPKATYSLWHVFNFTFFLTHHQFLQKQLYEFSLREFVLYRVYIKQIVLFLIFFITNIFRFFRIERMARDIHECFHDESLKVLCILKGGYQFCNDLTHYLKVLNRGSGNINQFLHQNAYFIMHFDISFNKCMLILMLE